MRIIAGEKRGTKLYTLEGENTRPTLDKVKESLFNIIQMDITNSVFLDLFAGSGAIGLEAISRGAKKAILCDNNKDAIQVIKKNIEKTKFQEKVNLYQGNYKDIIENRINEKIDIIFLDPPYKTNYIYIALETILKKDIVEKDSIIILETDQKEKIIDEISKLKIEITDERKYGRANLIFLKKTC